MKRFYLILACLTIFGCNSFKKITKSQKTAKESISESKIEKDSTASVTKTEAIENEAIYDLDFLSKQAGDFMNTVSSGQGSEFTIEKKGNQLKIRNKTPETESKETNVTEKKEEFVYTSEYIETEIKKTIKKIPFKYWIYLLLFLVFYYRKKIVGLLSFFFPALKSYKIVSFILGVKNKT